MKTPSIRYADDVRHWENFVIAKGYKYCARPIGYHGLCFFWRVKLAWLVFTGKMDALAWNGNQ